VEFSPKTTIYRTLGLELSLATIPYVSGGGLQFTADDAIVTTDSYR
jgi:hypothetical protein